ncbi:hypothetical protein EJ02DRAFT_427534 [Clathrospora elynae]|uniref:Uncharacterized protein n=1 Tax=Clathrospora elynae TaxID=706981 RepID=A0A6A5SAC6_9PLEO|nr:hypothetical protein EJ02DRAFT_427534 [Clathrospora elynae]
MYNPTYDSLTDNEWDEVAELANFLQAPYEMTKCLEGDNGASGFRSLWQILTNLQALWAYYIAATERTNNSQYYASAIAFGKEKLNTYFDIILIWYKKAEALLKKVFTQYVDKEVKAEEQLQLPPLSRQKLPANNNFKRQKRVTQLEEYCNNLPFDLTDASVGTVFQLPNPDAIYSQDKE